MKKSVFKFMAIVAAIICLSSCDDNDNVDPAAPGKYVLLTTNFTGNFTSYLTSYDNLPSGSISNVASKSKQTLNTSGLRVIGKYIYNMSNFEGEGGVHKQSVNEAGEIVSEGFIAVGAAISGSGQHVVVNDDLGFYFDGDRGLLKLQKFNPTTMQRTGEIDLTAQLSNPNYEFVSVGQNIQMVKEGKLYANVHYGNNTFKGFLDAQDNLVKLAVIDIATGNFEKLITYNAGKPQQVGWLGDNVMWDLGDDSNLYFNTLGTVAGGSGMILRIKAGETEIDQNWQLQIDDYIKDGFFVEVLAKGGKIYTRIPTEGIKADFSNIGNEVWKAVAIDINTKVSTPIENAPVGNFNGNGYGFQEIDSKLYLRVVRPSQNINGYYLLNGNNASQIFNVTQGGEAAGLVKIQ